MKKNYFMLVFATLMMAACANNDLVDDLVKEEVPQAIGFETFAQKATRAENSTNSDYSWSLNDHHTNFLVWGYKSVQDSYVFTGKEVSYSNSKWGYTGLVYWDKAAEDYEFYAAAPKDAGFTLNNNSNNVQNDDYFEIKNNYTVTAHNIANVAYQNSFVGTNNAVDLMIADKKNVQNSEFGSDVQLNFTHILSRLNITVSKDATMSEQTVKLKSLNLYNVNNVGKFNENATLNTTTLADGTHERWTLTANDDASEKVITYSYTNAEGYELKYVYEGNEDTPSGATKTAEYMLQSLIMPQTAAIESVNLNGTSTHLLTEPYFTIVYTITDSNNTEEFSASYNLASAFNLPGTKTLAFNEGWQNTLNITIKPATISFTGKVAVWGTGSVYNPTIN